jgi:hypothetical protein
VLCVSQLRRFGHIDRRSKTVLQWKSDGIVQAVSLSCIGKAALMYCQRDCWQIVANPGQENLVAVYFSCPVKGRVKSASRGRVKIGHYSGVRQSRLAFSDHPLKEKTMSKRLTMAQIDAIITLHATRHSNREIAVLLTVDRGTVGKYIAKAAVQNQPKRPSGRRRFRRASIRSKRPWDRPRFPCSCGYDNEKHRKWNIIGQLVSKRIVLLPLGHFATQVDRRVVIAGRDGLYLPKGTSRTSIPSRLPRKLVWLVGPRLYVGYP